MLSRRLALLMSVGRATRLRVGVTEERSLGAATRRGHGRASAAALPTPHGSYTCRCGALGRTHKHASRVPMRSPVVGLWARRDRVAHAHAPAPHRADTRARAARGPSLCFLPPSHSLLSSLRLVSAPRSAGRRRRICGPSAGAGYVPSVSARHAGRPGSETRVPPSKGHVMSWMGFGRPLYARLPHLYAPPLAAVLPASPQPQPPLRGRGHRCLCVSWGVGSGSVTLSGDE